MREITAPAGRVIRRKDRLDEPPYPTAMSLPDSVDPEIYEVADAPQAEEEDVTASVEMEEDANL